jgi:tRNA 2-thiouridine synthesizing protein A
MPPGTLVEAVCTDPGALQDIPAWRRLDGHRVVETGSEEANYLIRFRVTDCESEP